MLYRTQLLKDDQVRYNVHLAHLQQYDFSQGATRREFYRFMGAVERCEWKQSAYFLKKYRPLFEAAVPAWKATGDFRRRGPGHGKTGIVATRGVDDMTEGEEDESAESEDEPRPGPSRLRAGAAQARKRSRQMFLDVDVKLEAADTGLPTPSADHEDRRPALLIPDDVLVVASSENDEPPIPAPERLIKRPRRSAAERDTSVHGALPQPLIPSAHTSRTCAKYGSLSRDQLLVVLAERDSEIAGLRNDLIASQRRVIEMLDQR